LLFLVLYTPFIAFEISEGFESVRHTLAFTRVNRIAPHGESAFRLSWKALTAPFLIPPEMLPHPSGQLWGFFDAFQRVELVWFMGGFLYLIWRLIRGGWVKRAWTAHALLALWVLLPLLILVHIRVNWLPWYYFDTMYPSQFLVISIVISSLSPSREGPTPISDAPWGALRWLAYLALILILLSQGLFLWSLYASIAIGGAIHLTPRQILGFDGSLRSLLGETGMETMPVRYKKALTERMLSEFKVDGQTFEQNIHGTSFEDLREDKGFFFYMLSSQSEGKSRAEPGRHYLMLREDLFEEDLPEGQMDTLGPFRIIPYRPLIRSQAWKYSPTPSSGWHTEDFDDSMWKSVRLPRRGQHELFRYVITPLYAWEASSLCFRGWFDMPSVGKRLKIIVGLRDGFLPPAAAGHLYLNGIEVDASRLISYYTQFGRNLALVFDVTDAVKAGPNLLALQIFAATSAFDLDVYELLSAERNARGQP
jgi:hypothetical protein